MALSKNSAGREYYNGVATSDDLPGRIVIYKRNDFPGITEGYFW